MAEIVGPKSRMHFLLLHYSKDAQAPLSAFFNDNDDTSKLGMSPGQTLAST